MTFLKLINCKFNPFRHEGEKLRSYKGQGKNNRKALIFVSNPVFRITKKRIDTPNVDYWEYFCGISGFRGLSDVDIEFSDAECRCEVSLSLAWGEK